MAIYSAGGTFINQTFTGDSKTAIVDQVKVNLENAGWSVSGSSPDWTMQCPNTVQGLGMRVRAYDDGSGVCAKIQCYSENGSLAGSAMYLLPDVAKTFRIIAHRHQAFILVPGSIAARDFCCFGVPYIMSANLPTISRCIWYMGNAQSHTDTTSRNSLRSWMGAYHGGTAETGVAGAIVNSTAYARTTGGTNSMGLPRLASLNFGYDSPSPPSPGNTNAQFQWANGDYYLIEPFIGMGLTGYASVVCQGMGWLWDSLVVTGVLSGDITIPYNSANWYTITSNCTSARDTAVAYAPFGTLCVRVP